MKTPDARHKTEKTPVHLYYTLSMNYGVLCTQDRWEAFELGFLDSREPTVRYRIPEHSVILTYLRNNPEKGHW